MTRQTSSFSIAVPITVPTLILLKNPYRLLYSIQNLGPINYVAISSDPLVTAGILGSVHEGQHLALDQPMSDDTDQGPVYAVANTAAVTVAVVEISEAPSPQDNPIKRRSLRSEERETFRRETRTF